MKDFKDFEKIGQFTISVPEGRDQDKDFEKFCQKYGALASFFDKKIKTLGHTASLCPGRYRIDIFEIEERWKGSINDVATFLKRKKALFFDAGTFSFLWRKGRKKIPRSRNVFSINIFSIEEPSMVVYLTTNGTLCFHYVKWNITKKQNWSCEGPNWCFFSVKKIQLYQMKLMNFIHRFVWLFLFEIIWLFGLSLAQSSQCQHQCQPATLTLMLCFIHKNFDIAKDSAIIISMISTLTPSQIEKLSDYFIDLAKVWFASGVIGFFMSGSETKLSVESVFGGVMASFTFLAIGMFLLKTVNKTKKQ